MQDQSITHVTLLARLSDGSDPRAWEEFHARYFELIRNFARRRGQQPADCDDIAQEVLLSLSKALPGFRYDPAKGKFRSYLKTVTLRTVFRKSCQKRGAIDLEHIEEATQAAERDVEIEAAWEEEWRQYHLRQAMQTISTEFGPADRKAFERYAVAGQDARAVAEELDLSVDQVYQAKSRILRRLETLIDAQVRDEG